MYTKSFEDVNFQAGQVIEFPIDSLNPTKGFSITLSGYKRDPEVYTLKTDYVTVPTFELGYSASTPEETIQGAVKKLKDCVMKILKAATDLNKRTIMLKGGDRTHLEKLAENVYGKAKWYAFEYARGQWIISDQEKAGLYIAIRQDFTVYLDNIGNGYYTWGEFGFTCLNHRYVLSGRS